MRGRGKREEEGEEERMTGTAMGMKASEGGEKVDDDGNISRIILCRGIEVRNL